jgi:hypothetical protein
VYSFNKVERPEDCVMFWDTRTNERYAKYVRGLQGIKAAGRTCLLTTRVRGVGEGEREGLSGGSPAYSQDGSAAPGGKEGGGGWGRVLRESEGMEEHAPACSPRG